jgi:hypothetical protein
MLESQDVLIAVKLQAGRLRYGNMQDARLPVYLGRCPRLVCVAPLGLNAKHSGCPVFLGLRCACPGLSHQTPSGLFACRPVGAGDRDGGRCPVYLGRCPRLVYAAPLGLNAKPARRPIKQNNEYGVPRLTRPVQAIVSGSSSPNKYLRTVDAWLGMHKG